MLESEDVAGDAEPSGCRLSIRVSGLFCSTMAKLCASDYPKSGKFDHLGTLRALASGVEK